MAKINKPTIPMKIFEDLAEVSQKLRLNAIDKIDTHFLKVQGFEKEQMEVDESYTARRLTRGLASNRKMARIGFASALAQCLSKKYISVEDTLSLLSDVKISQYLTVSGAVGKSDKTQTVIGQLFFVASVCKGIEGSEKISKELKTEDVLKLSNFCVNAFKQKAVLRQMACSVFNKMVNIITHDSKAISSHGPAIFEQVKPFLQSGWRNPASEIDGADLLYLALVSESISPDNFWVEAKWLEENSEDSRYSLAYNLLSNPNELAGLLASARHTPRVHLAAVKLLEVIISEISNQKKMKKKFSTFWQELVDKRLLLLSSPLSHKAAALQLVLVALELLRDHPNLVPLVLSEPLIEFIISRLKRKTCREHEAVCSFFNELVSNISSKTAGEGSANIGDYHLYILSTMMKPPIRPWNELHSFFDKILHTSPQQAISKMSKMFISIADNASFEFSYDGSESTYQWEGENFALAARRWAISHLASHLVVASIAQCGENVSHTVNTVFKLCLFEEEDKETSTGEEKNEDALKKAHKLALFPREQSVYHVLRTISSTSFSGGNSNKIGLLDCSYALKKALKMLKKQLSHSETRLIEPMSAEVEKTFNSLVRISKSKAPKQSVLELLRLFACHSAILLVCYPNDVEIVQLNQEVRDLFLTVSEDAGSESSEENAARVFVDMLISLLSRKSKPIRQLTTNMFGKLLSNRKILSMLTASINADSDSQASSLVDLLVNALLNTQFIEDEKDDENQNSDVNDETDSDDVANSSGKPKRKRTLSGTIVSSTAPVVMSEDVEHPFEKDIDDAASSDSVTMEDEEMFKFDKVFAAAVKAAANSKAKVVQKEKKNQFRQMEEFHMKLASWLEMLVSTAQALMKENSEDCDGCKILTDIVAVVLNTLAGKKRIYSDAIEGRLCEIIRMILSPWRLSKAMEDGSVENVTSHLAGLGEMILDSSLNLARKSSSTQMKLDVASMAVEVLLICCSVDGKSSSMKAKSVIAVVKDSLITYLSHPSALGHIFFNNVVASSKVELKLLERIFFEPLLKCFNGENISLEEDSSENTSKKLKAFPRAQAARILTNSRLITAASYQTRPKIFEDMNFTLYQVLSAFVANLQGEDIPEKRKLSQPFFLKNVMELVKRHVNAVLSVGSEEKETKAMQLADIKSATDTIHKHCQTKKLADIRHACSAILKVLNKSSPKVEGEGSKSPQKRKIEKTDNPDKSRHEVNEGRKKKKKKNSE